MNKHGSPEDMNRMVARLEAEIARPDPDDGAIIDFPRGKAPLVQAGKIRGTAVAYTRHHGLVEWTDQAGLHFQWFLGSQIKRVTAEEWKGASGL